MKLLSLVKYYITILVISCSFYPACAFGQKTTDAFQKNSDNAHKSAQEKLRSNTRRTIGFNDSPFSNREEFSSRSSNHGSIFGSNPSSNPNTKQIGQEGMRYREENPKQETNKKTENAAQALFENATAENFEQREGKEVFDESLLAGSNS